MNPWSSAFIEVIYRTRQYAMAFDEAYYSHSTLIRRDFYFRNFAIARMRLALADYKVQERIAR